ncbi:MULTISPECIES: hypothetical protein [Priestia]|jgi:hypothetical protein|uniref:hypothetical protein n=1 Tax=Priestia TaxID=2800373 RepID=UPI000BF3D52B|nr:MULTISPECIES: hypothetical protein [Priestia]RFB40459.1 hypothetical protein DZB86_06410 [Bacillus sp. RC]MBM6601306.1 hypothetical protein [Priestia megaterium]MBV6734460.1 hypothetical protein [Priestia megaterium]MBW0928394.1 hypothetical protein [Priestia megaterium]MCA4154458.1 hypothetical protein [Priestia megaterium]
MDKRIETLKEKLPDNHKEVAVLTSHIFDALDKLTTEHRKYVDISAAAKIKPNPDEERAFFDTIYQVKTLIMSELEKTVEDIEHKGDKNWHKNYKDGIE